MTTLDDLQLPPPKSWDKFEDLCCDLWKMTWEDPDALRYGRQGQDQEGIDIIGKNKRDGTLQALQCKKKNILVNKKTSASEIEQIIKEAKRFEKDNSLKLHKLIIATTAPRDKDIIKKVLELSDKNEKSGLFKITIRFWDDILHELDDQPQLIERYGKILGVNISAIEKKIDSITEKHDITDSKIETIAEIHSDLVAGLSENMSGLEAGYHSQIDIAKNLLEENKAQEALDIFQEIKKKNWPKASDKIKYRLLTNIAVCYSELKEEGKSAKLFIEALQYNPEDDQALSNASLGNLILGDKAAAKEYAQKAIKKNPFSARGYSSLVQSSPEKLDKIISKTPKVISSTTDFAYAVGFVCRNKKDYKNSIKWFQIAVDTDEKGLPELKVALADALLQEFTNRNKDFYFSELPEHEKEHVVKAISLYNQAWTQIEKTSLRFKRANWLVNRSLAKKISGDLDGAIKDLDIAIEIEPNNHQNLIQRGILSFEKQNYDEALSFLDRISGELIPIELFLLKAEILESKGKTDEAIDILSSITKKASGVQYIHARELLFQYLLKQNKVNEAKKVIDQLFKEYPYRINTFIFRSQLLLAENKTDDATKILNEAKNHLGDNRIDIAFLAEQFYKLGLFDDASSMYEKFVDKENNTYLTRRLVECYYRGSYKKKALALCSKIRKKYGPIEYLTDIEIAIYEEMGDLESSILVLADYIKEFPDNLQMKIDYAGLLYRSRKMKKLDEILDQIPIINGVSLELQFKLAFLLFDRNRTDKALNLMYQIKKEYYDKPEVHFRYFGLFFKFIKDDYFKIDKVELNTAVKLTQDNGTETWYVITDESPELRFNEIASDHKIAKLTLGKKVGEVIDIGDSFASQKATIKEVKSKYLYALHGSMEMISSKSIESQSIRNIDLQNHATNKFDPSIFFRTIDEKAKTSNKIVSLYKSEQITIGVFAKLTGLDHISTSMSLILNPEVGAKVSSGVIGETIDAANKLSGNNSVLVVDLFTLLNISKAEIKDLIVKYYGKLGITQSLRDDFNEFLADQKGQKSKGSMFVGKKDGHYIKQEVSEKSVREQVKEISDLLKWTEKNCRTVAHPKTLEMNVKRKDEFQTMLGKSFFDSVMASCSDGYILFSDDLILRRLAETEEEFKIKTIWSQPLLLHLKNQNKIDQNEYNSVILKLMLNNNHFINFDDSILIVAAQRSLWQPKGEYSTIVSVLSNERYGIESIIIVSVNFIYQLWKEDISSDKKDRLVIELLDHVLSRKGAKELIIAYIGIKFQFLPTIHHHILILIDRRP